MSGAPGIRLGIDLGGTKIEIAALDGHGDFLLRERVATPQGDYAGTLRAIAGLVAQAEQRLGATGLPLGIGIPGSLSPLTGRVRNANSTALNGQPLREDLQALQRGWGVTLAAPLFDTQLAAALTGHGPGRSYQWLVEELLGGGHKALVFSQFTGHLALIRAYLVEQKINYKYLDGTTPTRERQQQVEGFQAGEGDLFLISLKAGGLGLNLSAADYVHHMDPWWNPAVEDQAADRAHRIGQKRPVTVYRLVTANTIEEKIVRLHQEKRDLANSLLEGADVSTRISAEQLLELIRSA